MPWIKVKVFIAGMTIQEKMDHVILQVGANDTCVNTYAAGTWIFTQARSPSFRAIRPDFVERNGTYHN
jgi:hypothetical protein